MKSSNRFLLGFGIIIGVLVITVVVLSLSAHSSDSFLAEDTPGGTVQRFLVALQDNDLQKANNYMSLDENGENMYQ